ncbi:hypothetical protein J3E72DRAFT_399387 [Bipolaris maydis]|nr:hypothetical protein J3E72DRAFT_399387 [Bipolaris maydis]
MKLINLVATTLPLLATSHPRAGPKSEPSDVWIGLDLKQCLTDASTKPLPKYSPDTNSLVAQQDTARAVIAAYNAWDIDDIMAYRSPDCKHRAYFSEIMHLYSNFTVTVKEEVHDAAARKCIIHATSRAETKIGPYTNEYALILTFTEDGRKVTKFDEFVDSAYSEQFVSALAKEGPPQ